MATIIHTTRRRPGRGSGALLLSIGACASILTVNPTAAHAAPAATATNVVSRLGYDVFAASNPSTHGMFLSRSTTEVRQAAQFGFTQNVGVLFDAGAQAAPGLEPIHQVWSKSGGFAFIPEGAELAATIGQQHFTDKGVAFYASRSQVAGLVPVYRLRSPQSQFSYTLDKADVARHLAAGWREGFAAFWVKPASTTDPNTLWVSPAGGGDGSSVTSPTTLAKAQQMARTLMGKGAGNVTVDLLDGVYRENSPAEFTSADSGTRGHTMVYQAAPGAHPVVSGATKVSGWQPWAGHDGMWRAPVAKGTRSRHMQVDGVPAQRAQADAASVLGTITRTGSGYTTSKDISWWANPTDVEFVWTGAAPHAMASNIQTYLEPRCEVASISRNASGGSTITMAQPCWGNARKLSVDIPTTVENNLTMVARPGQFYLDSSGGWVYYRPRTGQNMVSSDAELGVSQGLVKGSGVQNFTMRGITFSDDTWLRPSSGEGFAEIANNKIYDDSVPAPEWESMPPGAVEFDASAHISLDHVTVQRTGAAGVRFDPATHDSTLTGSTVQQTAANAVEVGGLYAASAQGASNITIVGDTITHVGLMYHGANGIFAGWIKNSTISHNDVSDTGYSGIAMGTDWDKDWTSYGGNKITWNHVHQVMQSTNLYDGGGIYSNLPCADNNRCTISDNVVDGDPQKYGALYLDNNARSTDVTSNVVEHIGKGVWWMLAASYATFDAQHVGQNSTISGNWTDTTATAQNIASNNKTSNNSLGLSSWPAAAQQVLNGAGVGK